METEENRQRYQAMCAECRYRARLHVMRPHGWACDYCYVTRRSRFGSYTSCPRVLSGETREAGRGRSEW